MRVTDLLRGPVPEPRAGTAKAIGPFTVVQRILGILLMLFSVTMLTPVLIDLIYDDGGRTAFIIGFLVTLIAGFIVWWPARGVQRELRLRDGTLVVVLFWLVLSLFGAIPLFIADQPWMSFTDAAFETVSGLTTTGATVIVGLDSLPHSILYYREQLHWLGGMGVIVLAVAILPMLGVGGMQLYRAEVPGPVKDAKLTPRIAETAKALWLLYVGITVLCAVAYWFAGMNLFDAVGHAFATLATGGFSNHDASLAYFDNDAILIIAIFFMFVSGINFSLHYLAWRGGNPLAYLRDPECRAYFFVMFGVSLIVSVALYWYHTYTDFGDALLNGTFQVVSIMTTTGFVSTNFSIWPTFIPILLMFMACIGGSAGSTAGGIKVVRLALLAKQSWRELIRVIHPNAEVPIKLGGKVVPPRVVQAVWGFFFIFVVSYAIMLLILLALGLDGLTAFSTLAACIGNTGPALGAAAANYATIDAPAKWVLIFAMLWGRLEIFTLLVVFTPAFWKR